jgi:multidrug efflux pump subunit AcrA (membrane-fusion protein)
MSIYDAALTVKERNALKKHVSGLQDEIDLLRTLVARGIGDCPDNATLDLLDAAKAAETLAKLELAQKRLIAKHDDELHNAWITALNDADAEKDNS